MSDNRARYVRDLGVLPTREMRIDLPRNGKGGGAINQRAMDVARRPLAETFSTKSMPSAVVTNETRVTGVKSRNPDERHAR